MQTCRLSCLLTAFRLLGLDGERDFSIWLGKGMDILSLGAGRNRETAISVVGLVQI